MQLSTSHNQVSNATLHRASTESALLLVLLLTILLLFPQTSTVRTFRRGHEPIAKLRRSQVRVNVDQQLSAWLEHFVYAVRVATDFELLMAGNKQKQGLLRILSRNGVLDCSRKDLDGRPWTSVDVGDETTMWLIARSERLKHFNCPIIETCVLTVMYESRPWILLSITLLRLF
jgi:hypothetical protein